MHRELGLWVSGGGSVLWLRPASGTRGRGRTRRTEVLLKRSGQGGQALCCRGLRKGHAASWLALSGPSAWWHGAAGADLGCCVSGELLFCQGTVGGLRHGCSIGQKGWEVADGSRPRAGCRRLRERGDADQNSEGGVPMRMLYRTTLSRTRTTLFSNRRIDSILIGNGMIA